MCELTKKCNACLKIKELFEFSKDKARPHGVSDKCRKCHSEKKLSARHVEPLGKFKICEVCLVEKDLSAFYKRPDRSYTHEPRCMQCTKEGKLIDKKIFNTVQKIVIVQNYNRNEKKNTFLLDGLLFCYECKHKIGVRGKKNGNYYMVCNNYRRNSKLKLCTSHGFSYSNLEETIINYIKNLFQKIDSEKVELEVKNGMTKYDYGKILKKLRNEIELINNNIDQMYVDKLNNKISEEMYERLLKKFKNEIGEKENKYLEIKQQKEESKQDNTEKIKSVVQEFLELKELTPEFMKVIINRIEIHQDKHVDLYFNFKQLNNLKEKT